MKRINQNIFALCVLSLVSCGEKKSEHSNVTMQETPASLLGDYQVILRPINNHLSGWIPNGKSDIEINTAKLNISTWLDDSSSVTHRQFILTGSRCPEIRDDSNQDGVIDILETLKASGKILLPLDNNLLVQLGPQDQYPFGNFSYEQKISLKSLEDELRQTDSNPNDYVVKLNPREVLSLENKVMIVLGLSEKILLPDSVQYFDEVSRQLSTPIVCGVIQRNDENQ